MSKLTTLLFIFMALGSCKEEPNYYCVIMIRKNLTNGYCGLTKHGDTLIQARKNDTLKIIIK